MKNYFFKPELENLSQGARLKFVRELRYMSKPNVAEFLELGGEKPTDSIDKYERNAREPQPERLEDLAELFDVSNYAIRRYNFESIPVSLVEEKIEELNKAYEDSKDENGESQYYYPDYTIRVLEELLEKR